MSTRLPLFWRVPRPAPKVASGDQGAETSSAPGIGFFADPVVPTIAEASCLARLTTGGSGHALNGFHKLRGSLCVVGGNEEFSKYRYSVIRKYRSDEVPFNRKGQGGDHNDHFGREFFEGF